MAAPSGITWGSIAGGKGRIGLYTSVSNGTTSATVTVQVWIWCKYSTSDSSNTLYYNNNATSATTSQGSKTINAKSNSSWSTSNQLKLATFTHTITKKTSAQTINCAAKLTGVEYIGATMTCTKSYTVPALASYTISYNGNGSTSGSVASQTKYYNTALTLRSNSYAKTGYRFAGWKWNNSGSVIAAGASWNGANAAGTMYAQWTANTYTVQFNGNGATTGTMANQSFTYAQTQTLTANAFGRGAGWAFTGWNTQPDGSGTSYSDAQSVSNLTATHGATVVLYAQWVLQYISPTVSNLTVLRYKVDPDNPGQYIADDEGTIMHVQFDWAVDQVVPSLLDPPITNYATQVLVEAKYHAHPTWTPVYRLTEYCDPEEVKPSSDSLSFEVDPTTISADWDKVYDVRVSITDYYGTYLDIESPQTVVEDFLSSAKFIMDFSPTGGVGIGVPAPDNGLQVGALDDNYGMNDEALLSAETIAKWEAILGL